MVKDVKVEVTCSERGKTEIKTMVGKEYSPEEYEKMVKERLQRAKHG